ncbi:patatin like phospholipase domain containing sws isoform X6 [Osmia lignaria lignaria]|uniref:patatin like phospholipase domain containing sws isoform X6 n=1 Tax=Osmia lignaria lignaria TaxID=1437193 RepID=UPI00402BB6FA
MALDDSSKVSKVVELFNKYNENLGSFILSRWIGKLITEYQTSKTLFIIIISILLIVLIISIIILRKWKNKEFLPEVKEFVGVGTGKPRFRKRDKLLFYGRKMLRKAKSISGQVHATGQGKKRKAVMRFARRLLQLKKDTVPLQLKVLEPPAEYLEEDLGPGDRVPPDALYMLQSIRVFGHFEKPVFLKLCKHTEIMNLPAGSTLFKIGDPDENLFIVQQGLVNVYITGPDGSQISLKLVKTGESVTSLLSFTDVLTGHTSTYKTVSARAVEDSIVVKLPMSAFQEVFQDHPDAFVRVIQVIMVRLQRVTFTALHQYLGLSAELVNQGTHKKKQSPFSGSPVRSRTKESFTSQSAENQFSAPATTSSEQHASSEIPHRETCSLNSHQSVPIVISRRSKTNLDWKNENLSSQSGQNTADMVPECDSHWPNSSTMTPQQSQHGSQPDVVHTGNSHQNKKRSTTIEPIQQQLDDAHLVQIATEAFVRELGLEDDSILKDGKVQIREVPAGTYLMKEESHKDVALVYVVSGALLVSQRVSEGRDIGQEVHMFSAHQGEIVGGLAVLTGEPSFYTIRAKHPSRIALLSKPTFFAIMREQPTVVLHVAHSVVRRLSPFVRQVDFALDWLFLESGRAVYRQGDESDSTFIVLSGRLRSVITYTNGKKELVAEYGKGDLVGIVEMVTQTPRSTTVMAVRDSELAKLPEGLFNVIKLRFPIVVTRLINLLGHRILGTWQQAHAKNGSNDTQRAAATVDARPAQVNFSTVAIVPVSDDVPLTAFTYELYHSLCAIGPCLRLTSEVVRKTLGSTIMEPVNEYRLTSWLAQQEDQHRISLYQCDSTYTLWTQRCVRQADCILIVGLGDRPPSIGRTEREVERLVMRTQKELVLLHREGGQRPSNTVQWLNMRSWVSSHHHIQCPKRMFTRRSQYRINELYSKVLMSEPNVHSDFSRLARWLTGTSVGLVLGGGGARGAAHVGMLKAVLEAGIPIDMVGGVSIGAFMGALWCMEKNITTTTQKAREWSKKMTQWWRQIMDLTYPVTSMFSGKDFNKTIQTTFGDTYIEDLWLPYFIITTDITDSCMRTHTHGLLWRYIRASMTIAGVFPPICDPLDGHLLVDGCYVNNVPADEMLRQGAHHILAIDVGSQDDTDLTNYGDSLSGWWLLWKRWNPFATPVKVPNLPDIQSRLAYVSCVRQLEEVKNSDYCEYIRPPIDKYKTLQFTNFDEIKDVGYQHGKTYFEGQSKAGVLPRFNADRENARALRAKHQAANQQSLSSYTFTDLAQMVCKVSRGNRYVDLDIDTDTDELEEYEADLEEDAQEVGYASEPTAGILDQSPDDSRMRGRAGVSLSLSDTEAESELDYHTKMF